MSLDSLDSLDSYGREFAALNPAQQQVLDDLLAVGRRRPEGERDLARRLREQLETQLADTAGEPEGLVISKSAMDALECDGRYLDWDGEPFTWTPATVRGQVAHSAIAVDLAGNQRRAPADVVDHVWRQFAASGRSAGDYLAALGQVDGDALRAEVLDVLVEFRQVFPPLPSAWQPRTEPEFRVTCRGGDVVLVGRPDLMVGRATVDRRRMLLIDLKSGQRLPARHRADMRFYALLATLKYGVAPFRVATFYLAEAAWDAEDVTAATLEVTVADVAEKARRAALLRSGSVPPESLRLVPTASCAWCGRARACPAVLRRPEPHLRVASA